MFHFFPAQLTVVDGADSALTSTGSIAITVVDQNDAPTCPTTSFTVPQHDDGISNPSVANHGLPGAVVGTVAGEDEDATDPGNTLVYDIQSGDSSNAFAFGTGAQDKARLYVNSITTGLKQQGTTYTLTVRVRDDDSASSTCTVTVTVTESNNAPNFNDQTFSIDENNLGNSALTSGIIAEAPNGLVADDGSSGASTPTYLLNYTIVGSNPTGWQDGKIMAFSGDPGSLKLRENEYFDYEQTPQVLLYVECEDDHGGKFCFLSFLRGE